jgi:hypothetical protein
MCLLLCHVSLRGLEGTWNGKMILELKIAPKIK